MRKRIFSLLLTALLLIALLPAAVFAEGNITVNLGSVRAGSTLNILMATTDSGTASLAGGVLPDSCRIDTEQQGGSVALYLRGEPTVAGVYDFTLVVTADASANSSDNSDTAVSREEDTDTDPDPTPETPSEPAVIATLSCSITVLPALPEFTVQDVECFVGEDARIELEVHISDNGRLSYQWYSNSVKSNENGELLKGKTERILPLDTEFPGVSYYYCVVTNTNSGSTETVTTPVITLNVTEPTITSVSIASLPEKLEYVEGEELNTKGLTLLVRYSNGQSLTDDEGFTCSPTKLETVGTQTITVDYQDNLCSFPVIVKEDKERVEGIALVTLPTKREYQIGEWLDTQGMVLQVITNKGNRSEITTGFTCSPQVMESAGIQTITVTYEEQTTSFSVTVLGGAKSVKSIEISTLPTRLTYTVGENFDPSGMVLKVVTDQGDELVRSGFTCEPARFTHEGPQTVTVSYSGQTCTMELTVSPAPSAPAATEKPSPTPAPSKPVVTPAPSGRTNRSSRSDVGTLLVVILIFSLIALATLVVYIILSRKEEFLELWHQITGRNGKGKKK